MAYSTVDRTAYNALVDDSGSGTDGSVWDKADVADILNAIDGIFSGTFGLQCNGPLRERNRSFNVGDWLAYTPVWASVGVLPVIGNGTLSGRYSEIGSTVFYELRLDVGSTTTFGTGAWLFSLPVNRRNDVFVVMSPSGWYALDSSSGAQYVAGVAVYNTTQVEPVYSTAPPSLNGSLTGTTPFTWATGDALVISGSYEAA